jgi:hypothetical protein
MMDSTIMAVALLPRTPQIRALAQLFGAEG